MQFVYAILLLSVTLVIEQCDRVDSAAAPFLNGRPKRAIVNQVKDIQFTEFSII